MRVLLPVLVKVIEHDPVCDEFSVALQDSLVLAVTVTEPVGPAPGPVVVKLMVTAC